MDSQATDWSYQPILDELSAFMMNPICHEPMSTAEVPKDLYSNAVKPMSKEPMSTDEVPKYPYSDAAELSSVELISTAELLSHMYTDSMNLMPREPISTAEAPNYPYSDAVNPIPYKTSSVVDDFNNLYSHIFNPISRESIDDHAKPLSLRSKPGPNPINHNLLQEPYPLLSFIELKNTIHNREDTVFFTFFVDENNTFAYRCGICGVQCDECDYHVWERHSGKYYKYSCSRCDVIVTSKASAKYHFNRYHSPRRKHFYQECGVGFRHKNDLYSHINQHKISFGPNPMPYLQSTWNELMVPEVSRGVKRRSSDE